MVVSAEFKSMWVKGKEANWDINRDNEILKKYLEKLLNWPGLLEEQKQKIIGYDKSNAINGVKVTSRASILFTMKDFALFVKKPFEQVAKKDIEDYFYDLLNRKSRRNRTFASSTIKDRKIVIRRFFQWMHGLPKGQYPDIVSWLQTKSNYNFKLPETIITLDDVKQILDKGCFETSHKALISVLWELGLRAGELVAINVGDVKPENIGIVVYIRKSKTKPRELFVYDSTPILKQWLNSHPYKDNPEAPLFICLSKRDFGNRLTVTGLRELIISLSKKAGITKKVYSHLFRHGSLSHQSTYLTEQELKLQAGWSGDSKMPRIYCHLTVDDLRRKQMERRGLLPEDKVQNQLQAVECDRCKTLNDCTSIYCCKCSYPLQKQEALKIATSTKIRESILTLILDDQQIQNRIIKLTQEDTRIKKLSEALAKIVPTTL